MLTQQNYIAIARFLAQEVAKDLDYNEIYKLAEMQLTRDFIRKNNMETLVEDYGEKYDYVFLEHGVEPMR